LYVDNIGSVAVHPLVTVVEATTVTDLASIVTVSVPTASLESKLSVTVSPAFASVVLTLFDAIETPESVGATPSVGVTV